MKFPRRPSIWERMKESWRVWRRPAQAYVPHRDLPTYIELLKAEDDAISQKIVEVMEQALRDPERRGVWFS